MQRSPGPVYDQRIAIGFEMARFYPRPKHDDAPVTAIISSIAELETVDAADRPAAARVAIEAHRIEGYGIVKKLQSFFFAYSFGMTAGGFAGAHGVEPKSAHGDTEKEEHELGHNPLTLAGQDKD
jgi:hypothetical protein